MYLCQWGAGPQVIYNPITAMGFSTMFTFKLYILLRGKNCWCPIAVMGVADYLGPELMLSGTYF